MTLISSIMRRYVSEIVSNPFSPEALGKAIAIRDYLETRPDLLTEDERKTINEFLDLVGEARKVALI